MTNGPALRYWNVNAQECEVLEERSPPSRLRLKNGSIYTFLSIPAENRSRTLVGEIHASGSGNLSIRISTCLRPPDSKEKAFSHSIKKEMGPFVLTPEPLRLKFAVDIDPYEQGYLYVRVAGEAVINHVSGVLVEK